MEWISVKTKLPPNNTDCIVWVQNHPYYSGSFFAEVTFNKNFDSIKIRDNRFVLYENGGEYESDFTDGVTHWFIPTNPNIKK